MKISLTAGWEDFLKIQRDERVILEQTVLGIIAPEASISVRNAPKSLAAGAPPQTPLGELTALPPDPLAVMGWEGDLVATLLRCKLCAPCSWPVPLAVLRLATGLLLYLF